MPCCFGILNVRVVVSLREVFSSGYDLHQSCINGVDTAPGSAVGRIFDILAAIFAEWKLAAFDVTDE